MSQDPSISIIIPIYNAETLIENCVNSILSQAYTDYEIILVDDGSIDKSLQVCQNIANKHHNIIVLHKKNGGQTSARKLGFEYSTGEYTLLTRMIISHKIHFLFYIIKPLRKV